VSEALANAAKHSRGTKADVAVWCDERAIRATIADDGVGGAAIPGSSGLIGLLDRIEALGGTFTLESPPGEGTTISIELPLSAGPRSDPRL
jgi:signal transduction histidine kinase